METSTALSSSSNNLEIPSMMPHFLFQLFQDHKVDPSQILIVNDNPKSVLSAASVSRSSSSSGSSNLTPQNHVPMEDSDDSDPEIITVGRHHVVERWGSEPVAEYDSDSVLQLARQRSSVHLVGEPFKVKRTDKWMGDSKPNSDSSLSMPQRKSSLESTSIETTSAQALANGAAIAAGKDIAPQRPPRKGKRPDKTNSMGSSEASSSTSSSNTAAALGANAYLSQNRHTRKQGRRASLNNSTDAQKAAWAAAIARSPPRGGERKRAPRRSSMDNAFITTDKAMELNLSNHGLLRSAQGSSKSPPLPAFRKQVRRASMDNNAYTVRSTMSMDLRTHSQPAVPRPPSKSPPRPSSGRKQARRGSVDTALSAALQISSSPLTTTNSRPPTAPTKSSSSSSKSPPRPSSGRKQARRASMDTAFFKATTNTFSTLYCAPSTIAANLIQRHRQQRSFCKNSSPNEPIE